VKEIKGLVKKVVQCVAEFMLKVDRGGRGNYKFGGKSVELESV
jgi:hypothetical protein